MKITICILLTIATCVTAQGQRKGSYHGRFPERQPSDSIAITYVALENNFRLYPELVKFIQEVSDTSALFRKGFGFVIVENLHRFPRRPVSAQEVDKMDRIPVSSFSMTAISYVLSEDSQLTRYPAYYSIVSDRLVLLYDETLEGYTRPLYTADSKRKIADLVKNTLKDALKPDFVFYHPFEKRFFTLSNEQRKAMSDEAIMKTANLTVNEYRKVTTYFGGPPTYTDY